MPIEARILFVTSVEPALSRAGSGLTALSIQKCLELESSNVRTLTVSAGDRICTNGEDHVVAYHFAALEAIQRSGIHCNTAFLDDPPWKPTMFRWRDTAAELSVEYAQFTLDTWYERLTWPERIRRLTQGVNRVYGFSAGEAQYYRSISVDAQYLPRPIVDEFGARACQQWETRRTARPFRLMLIGHVQGTATRAGLVWFLSQVLPKIENCEVRIVGGDAPDMELRRLAWRQPVTWVGHVQPATSEFLNTDIVVVPTPFRLGARVRILTAWAAGCCVVANEADRFGIPEMESWGNCLLSETPQHMARHINELSHNRHFLSRFGRQARKDYEEYFQVRPLLSWGAQAREREFVGASR